ncbi:hypothetical protein [Nonomuraea sp. NPDC049480]|uniref:SbtR family transcriptional regulator n=1 Tax=Nonomuraea sp. NPDC049480 TaxID=3364353 RepID=UPI0037BB4C8F
MDLAPLRSQAVAFGRSSRRRQRARAQQAGALRNDVGPIDLAFFMMANSRVAEAEPEQWRRHFTLMLDALRAAPRGGPAAR